MKVTLCFLLLLPSSLWACMPSSEEVRKNFMLVDKNKDESLDIGELRIYFESDPSKYFLSSNKVFAYLDKDNNKKISLNEYDPTYGIKNQKRCMP